MDPVGPLARRFPLVARTRPACTPLERRVADLAVRARKAGHERDLAEAALVHNRAALLASDAGLPGLARTWCHRQANAYLRSHPLGAQGARHALEPLTNLARLHIREGEGEQAFHLIDTLYTAVATRTAAVVDGIEIPADLTDCDQAHREVRRWLWAVMLATGARALASAGRWEEARDRLAGYKGIGRRMLDGRQVAVIARLVAHDTAGALDLLDHTVPGDPSENAVTTCLALLCTDHDRDRARLLARYRNLDLAHPGVDVFTTRLALSAIDAAGGIDTPQTHPVAVELIDRTLARPDGYTARDLLAHSGCTSLLSAHQHDRLARQITACGLGEGTLPAPLREELETALDTTEEIIDDLAGG
ncbi:hypothetical protein ACFVUH_08010 [Kitasatospora sp. NPDC058032]|uniref:hypothetical protein n=1 Tax=Kitasatospora sp. NPDC058032 TaxID=3346307 RepID=UPI0036DA09DC